MKSYKLLITILLLPLTLMAQSRNDAGLRGDAGAVSGFFDANQPVNFPDGANSWWHLLDTRHSNLANNWAMQFAGSFFDQNLYFRKTMDNPSTAWSKVILETEGKVKIGTTTIIGNLKGTDYNENLRLPNSAAGYSCIAFGAIADNGTGPGQWSVIKHPENQGSKFTIRCNAEDYLSILTNGNIGVGTVSPKEKLSVNGKIRAQEIKVETSNWPDYVFTKDYVLPTLAETEKHIKEKGHLPGIPSAKEAQENGIELGEMNKQLLKKVEELTLHLIKKDKEMAELLNRVKLLEQNRK